MFSSSRQHSTAIWKRRRPKKDPRKTMGISESALAGCLRKGEVVGIIPPARKAMAVGMSSAQEKMQVACLKTSHLVPEFCY